MFTGRLPFLAEGLGELLLAHMTQQPSPPHELADIPPGIEACILRALEKDLNVRFQHVEEVLVALGGELSGPYSLPAPPNKVGPDDRTMARPPNSDTVGGAHGEALPTAMSQKKRPWAIVLGAVVLVGGVGAFIVQQQQKPDKPPIAQPPVEKEKPPVEKPQQPEAASLNVKTVPAEAQLFLDDAPVQNPFSGKFPKNDVKHRLTVKAAGYRSESEWITFDGDRALTITLQKGSGSHEKKPDSAPKEAEVDTHGKPIYKGTKGKLITTFPE
jgi:hypothetical protein